MLTGHKIRFRIKANIFFFINNYYPVFVCGISGSGTSLLAGLLDQNYKTAGFADESALRTFNDSPFKIKSSSYYVTPDNYYRNMLIPENIPPKILRKHLLKLYRVKTRFPLKAPFIIDKAPNPNMVRTKQLRKAFPESKFILIFRNPLASVEGLRRKWIIFKKASLEEVCHFWKQLHMDFLKDTEEFTFDVMGVSYEDLTSNKNEVLSYLADSIGFERREKNFNYTSRSNIPGCNLRNVQNGIIIVNEDANRESIKRLTADESVYIKKALSPFYIELKKRFERRTYNE